jgi:acyl carrier protein
MNKIEVLQQVENIFKDVLDDKNITLADTTVAGGVDGWDSLAHVQLVVAMERHFKIKFNSKEIFLWKNVGEILETIISKLN